MSKNRENTYMRKAIQFLPIALLAIVCVIVYFNCLFNGFVFDDRGTIVENKYIADILANLPSFFNSSYFIIAELEASYRPVATFSYHILYALFEFNPFGYHLSSLILHILNVILIYALMNLLQENKLSSLVAGLLFACHPVLTEAVNGISFNEDLLATFFYLLSFIFYLKLDPGDKKLKIGHYLLSLVFYLLGLLSKEMAITLPVIVLFYDIFIRQAPGGDGFVPRIVQKLKRRIFLYLGYAAVSIFYLSLNFIIITKAVDGQQFGYDNIGERLLYLPDHIFNFIRLAILPVNLSADYAFSYPKNFFEMYNLISVIGVGVVVISSLVVYKKQKEVFFGIWWFLLTLFPVYNLIEIFNPMADRYLYLPLVGFCLVLSLLLTDLIPRKLTFAPQKSKMVIVSLIVILLVAYSTTTIARNRDWKDGFSLWSKTLQTNPNSAAAHGNLGRAYLDLGQLNEAINEFRAALQIRPRSYKAHYNLGLAYEKKGLFKEAILQYENSLNFKPDYVNAHFNLGNIYKQLNLLDKAIFAYKNVIEIDPGDIEARNNLGVIYAMQGNFANAIKQWENVLSIDPNNHSAADNIRKAKKLLNKNS
jgi:tetratricopeptide (TPR) repeat protein